MRMHLSITAFFCTFFLAFPAFAQPAYEMTIKRVRDNGEMVGKQLYAVSVKCQPKTKSPPRARVSNGAIFAKYYTVSHLVVVTQKSISGPPAITALPNDALAVVHVYSANRTSGWENRRCDQTFFVSGAEPLALVAVANFTEENELSGTVKLISNALKTAAPLLSLFGASAPAAAITQYFTGMDNVTAPLQKLLTDLNKTENTGQKEDNLHAGVYRIDTPLSRTTVEIRPLESIVQDPTTRFTSYLEKQLSTVTATLDVANLEQKCRMARDAIIRLGFNSLTDRGYALLQLGFKSGFSKKQLIECLGEKEARAVANLGPYFWKGHEEERFSKSDLDNLLPNSQSSLVEQPTYAADLEKNLFGLVTALSISGRLGTVPEGQKKSLVNALSDRISISDSTTVQLIGDQQPATPDELASLLFSKGIVRFGCYGPMKAEMDPASDGAIAYFLGFKIDKTATSATAADAVVFRPLYKARKIDSLGISVSPDQIKSVLNGRQGCGDLPVVTKTAAASAN